MPDDIILSKDDHTNLVILITVMREVRLDVRDIKANFDINHKDHEDRIRSLEEVKIKFDPAVLVERANKALDEWERFNERKKVYSFILHLASGAFGGAVVFFMHIAKLF